MKTLKTVLLYLSWFPLAIIDFLVALTAYPLAPIAALFANKGKLPKLFWYLETYDNPVEGDSGHIQRWRTFAKHFGAFGRYCQRVAWLWRNKAYNFSYHITGRNISHPVSWWGKAGVDAFENKVNPGWVFLKTPEAWSFYAYVPWVKIGKRQFYCRVYLGWKFKGEADQAGSVQRGMLSTFVSPFRNREVK